MSLSGWREAIAAIALILFIGGCGGSDRPSTSPPLSSTKDGTSKQWTSAQLQGALLPELSAAGYHDSTPEGAPISGPYSSVVRDVLGQEPWPEDPTGCLKRMSAIGRIESLGANAMHAPSAVIIWSMESNVKPQASLSLVAVPNHLAERLIREPVPTDCRDYTVPSINLRYTEESAEPFQIGQGGVLLSTRSRAVQGESRTFRVIFYARDYLAVIDVFGKGATKAIAKEYAKQQYDRAERVLK